MKKIISMTFFLLLAIALCATSPQASFQGKAAGPTKVAGPTANGGSLLLVTDNFNRANSATLGANWSNASGVADPIQVLSNQAANTSGTFSVEVWTANAFTSNQFSKATFISIGSTRTNVIARAQVATNDLYACGKYDAFDGNHYVLFKTVAGSTTEIGIPATAIVTANDIVELDAVGTTLTCKVNGSTIFTQTDASLSGGSPGLQFNDGGAAAIADDWSGGNL